MPTLIRNESHRGAEPRRDHRQSRGSSRQGTWPCSRLLTFVGLVVSLAATASSQSILLDQLGLDPPGGGVNRLSVTIATNQIGSDTEVANVTGSVQGNLDFQIRGNALEPVGFTFTGGDVFLSDLNFSFLFGAVHVTTTGLAATPSTVDPPSTISMGSFAASDHQLTIDRGTINAAGSILDLTTSPILATGTGTGTVTLQNAGGNLWQTIFTIPVAFSETFLVTNVPIVGTVTGTISGSGQVRFRQTFQFQWVRGDYDFNGTLDCADIDLLQAAIRHSSTNLTFDVTGDGVVDSLDYPAWVTDLKRTRIGDANFDFVVDGSDFGIWNTTKFTANRGWCQGDFNGDGVSDGSDFGLWNANKFTSADSAQGGASPIPEPQFTLLAALLACVFPRFGQDD